MTEVQTRSSGASGSGLPLADDLCNGADAIARFVYGEPSDEKAAESNRRKIYHAIDKHGFPAFKLGGLITSRKSTILRWIESQEQTA